MENWDIEVSYAEMPCSFRLAPESFDFGENMPERLDRLIASGAMPPVVVAFPDCFTKLGGNQYINSSAI